eukprot:scaffold41923_cov75-Attheya_sp.AAC.2
MRAERASSDSFGSDASSSTLAREANRLKSCCRSGCAFRWSSEAGCKTRDNAWTEADNRNSYCCTRSSSW